MNHRPTPEQEKIFLYTKKRPENLMIKALAGCGKCLGINTPILMYDGTIKKVQDIKIGELLMGDDSSPRKVLNINSGNGNLYEIIPTKGDTWICNDIHVLTHYHEKKKCLVDIPLNEINYPKYSNGNYRYARLQRTSVEFSENNDIIDPYLLGLWLGDGNKIDDNPKLTINENDIEILNYLKKVNYKNIGDNLLITPNYHSYQNNNILRDEFRLCYNNAGNIYIPKKYLINSKNNRERLLAGLLDSDGYNNNKYFEIVTKYDELSDNILFLCRSLGFAAYKKKTKKSLNFSGIYWRISICGSFENLPFFRKKNIINERKQIKSVLRTRFKTKSIGFGKYYGFTLNGNGRFLLGDFTITHNTSTAIECAKLLPKDKNIMFLAFNKHIQEELKLKLPEHIRCYTTYGLGMSAIKRKYGESIQFDEFKADKIILKKSKSWKLSEELDNEEEVSIYLNNIKKLANLCRLTLTTKQEYIPYIAERHDIPLTKPNDIKRVLKVLDEMSTDRKTFDYTDMIFLPAIDNSIWFFPQDYVFVDEFQDINRTQIKIIEKILKHNRTTKKLEGKLFIFGDENQCQPAGTKILMSDGTEKNIENICINDKVVSYDRNGCGHYIGYFKNHRWAGKSMQKYGVNVNNVSKRKYIGKIIVIKSNGNTTKYTPNHRCVVRINKNSKHKYILYLMEKDGYFRIGISPIWSKNGNNFIIKRIKQENADKFWILNTYENKFNAYLDEQFYSLKYTIPQLIFCHRQQKGNINQTIINEFYKRFDKDELKFNALKILNNFNRIYEYPLWIKHNGYDFSKNHMFEINACNIISKLMEIVQFDDTHLRKTNKSSKVIIAKYIDIDELYYENYNDFVYSLDINKFKLYVADNILTHNSIYGFNGADDRVSSYFENFPNIKILPLTTSFRCSKNVIAKAQEIVPDIKALPDAPDGIVREGNVLEEAQSGDFVLCRTTMPLVKLFFKFLFQHKKAIIKGSDIGVHLIELIGNINNIQTLISFWENELIKFKKDLNNEGVLNPNEHSGYATLEDKVNTLLFLAKISESIMDLKYKIKSIFTDEIQGIVLSTVHKIKGLEANRVFIIRPDLLPMQTNKPWQYAQEKNLEYVAITRSRLELIYDNKWKDE